MNNIMSYNGYSARVEYSEEDETFVGHIAGIRDIVGFDGESVAELGASFREAVDNYLDVCARTARSPQKPYSGQVMFRIPPELHARAATAAAVSGKSLNQWATEVIAAAAA